MNGPIKNALLTLIMVTMLAVTAHAGNFPRSNIPVNHEFARCNTCHATDKVNDVASNNVCLTCHKAGSTVVTNKQFYIGDMANPFGTTIEAQEKDTYTHSSHEWSATDDNPAAGALPPTNPDLLILNAYVGKLSCNRCHDLHSPAPNTPHLRSYNDGDKMCLDCHRLRDTRGHISGTHPVNVDYASAISKSPGEFATKPINSNPSNPTSALPLIDGKVMCSTCHGVHFTDSNSSTLDNYSTANENGLKHSKGYLLRTDYRYVNYTSPDSPNICNNCHMDKHAHNGGGQKVRCTDCHSGHVDFDPNALDPKSMVPNIFMVKRYMNWSSATGWKDNLSIRKQTFFRYTTGQKYLYKRADGKGVCESCHVVPPAGGKYPEIHNVPEAEASVCNDCHKHSGKWSFTACKSCHGQPPVSKETAAANYFETTGKDEALSGHAAHTAGTKYGCVECHYTGSPEGIHNNGNFQNVFVAGYERLADNHGLVPIYNASGTCSNVYCHSNGAPAGKTLEAKETPNWLTKNTQGCNLCHEASPTTNAHGVHIAKGYSCENCHSITATGSTAIKDKTKHANDQKEISFNSVGLPVTITGSNCANVYCHSNGKGAYSNPVWTTPASGNCGTCHPTTGNATGAHQAHLSTGVAYGPKLNQYSVATACNSCHGPNYEANHINGTSELTTEANCTASCHKNGLGSAQWATGRTGITCESCHTGNLSVVNDITAPDKGLAETKGHGKNLSSTGVAMNYDCTACHDQNAKHIDANATDTRLLPAYTGALNKECNECHASTKLNMPTHVTDIVGMKPASNTAPSACNTCHDLHGSSNRGMIRAKIVVNSISYDITYKNTTSMVSNVMVGGIYTGLCQICHTKTGHYKNNVQETLHYVGYRCTECHQHKAVDTVYAFQPNGGCNTCHGYPPVQSVAGLGLQDNYTGAKSQNYVGGGGAHAVPGHIPAKAKPSEAFANCANCHFGSDTGLHANDGDVTKPANINVSVNPKYKFDAKRSIVYSGNKANDTTYFSGTCSNVSCHFQKSPKWSSEK